MSFLKRLFGGGGGEKEPRAIAEEEHEGYRIIAAPIPVDGQFRLAGTISKTVDGEERTHRLIRADLFSSAEDAAQFTLMKAKQVIKEQGDRMFG